MNDKLVECLIKMVNLRECKDLTGYFVEKISHLNSVTNVQLFQETKIRLLNKPTNDQKHGRLFNRVENNGHVDDAPIDDFLDKYLINEQLESKIESTFIYPIEISKELTKILYFESDDLSKDNQFIISSLCDVFKNQTQLLLSGETDELTGLRNRTSFERFSKKIFYSNEAFGSMKQSCFSILDIDHFKKVNDEYGHLYGDEVLLLFAKLMKEQFRTSDYLFRYGGEEFAVILTDCKPEQAQLTLERFRRAANDFNYPQIGQKTVSIGYTILKPENGAPLTIEQADQALYYSKENGRNKTTYYMDLQNQKIQAQKAETTLFFKD